MGHADPGQDQKPAVVGHERQAARAGRIIPADPAVAGFRFPGRSTEEQARQIASVAVPRQVGHVFTDGAAEAQVMVARQIAREEGVIRRSRPHRLQAHRLEVRQRLGDVRGRTFVVGRGRRDGRTPRGLLPARRQREQAALFQLQQEAAGGHVFELAGACAPVPCFRHIHRDAPAAPIGVSRDQATHLSEVQLAQLSALEEVRGFHPPKSNKEDGAESSEKMPATVRKGSEDLSSYLFCLVRASWQL